MNQIFRKISITFFLSVIVLSGCKKEETSTSEFEEIQFPGENELSWNYPVKPGSEQWKAIRSHAEVVEACQIPRDIIADLPTEELLVLCLNYPLLLDISAFNFFSDGYATYETNFNGVRELYQRNNAPSVLFAWYKQVKIESANFYSTISFVFKISVVEYMLSAPDVISKYTSAQKKEIAAKLWSRLNYKKSQPDDFGNVCINSTYRALIKIIKCDANGKLSPDNKKLADYFAGGFAAPENVQKQADEIIRTYLTQQ